MTCSQNLLIDSWSRNTDKILECQSSNDYAVDNQYVDEVLSQLDHSSLDMFQIMSVPAIHKNVTKHFENNVSKPHDETKRDINKSYEILYYYYLKQSQRKS